MALYRLEKVSADAIKPSGTETLLHIMLRDADTGTLVPESLIVADADITDQARLMSAICDAFNTEYTPNDFGCP